MGEDAGVRRLGPADMRVMPWKNGLGSTTEIAVHPPGVGVDQLVWRFSLALVREDGPFSHFPGVDRQILPLDAPGFALQHGDAGEVRVAAYTVHVFPGDEQTACRLLGGPVRDLNLMVRRGAARGTLQAVTRGGPVGGLYEGDVTRILFCDRGRLGLLGGEAIGPGEGLRLDGTAPAWEVWIEDGGAGALVEVSVGPTGI